MIRVIERSGCYPWSKICYNYWFRALPAVQLIFPLWFLYQRHRMLDSLDSWFINPSPAKVLPMGAPHAVLSHFRSTFICSDVKRVVGVLRSCCLIYPPGSFRCGCRCGFYFVCIFCRHFFPMLAHQRTTSEIKRFCAHQEGLPSHQLSRSSGSPGPFGAIVIAFL